MNNPMSQPDPLSLKGNLAENFKVFRQSFEIYMIASGYDKKPERRQANILLHVIGIDAVKVYNGFHWEEGENKENVETILGKFHTFCTPRKNIPVERHKFNTRVQQPEEKFDAFYSDLCNLANDCELEPLKDSCIRDRILCGIRDNKLRRDLLMKADYTLQQVIDSCRAAEISYQNNKLFQQSEKVEETVHEVRNGYRSHQRQQSYHESRNGNKGPGYKAFRQKPQTTYRKPAEDGRVGNGRCKYCGKHPHEKGSCPARRAVCSSCHKVGHYRSVCLSRSNDRSRDVHTIQSDENEDFKNEVFLGAVNSGDQPSAKSTKDWRVNIKLGHVDVIFKVDTGADVIVIPKRVYIKYFKEKRLLTSNRILNGPDNHHLDNLGYFDADLSWNGIIVREKIFVIDQLSMPLLSREACHKLGVVLFMGNIDQSSSILEEFPELFTGLGKMEEPYHIQLTDNAEPYSVDVPRRVAIPMLPLVKEELKRLENLGVIIPVDQPTEWCAPLTVLLKKRKLDEKQSVRICVDLTKLNKAVRRERHILPSVDHVLGQMAGGRVFSKLDANSGFHQIPLTEESSYLTTFMSPFGRFRYLRLPFGISSGPELFMKRMCKILEGLEGVSCLMDDIVVFGISQEDHDLKLRKVLTRLREHGLTLNKSKCSIGKSEIKFLGQIVSEQGIRADLDKISAIKNFPQPQDVSDIRRLLGMVNQLSKFIENLAEITKPLRDLLCIDNAWIWDKAQENSFQNIVKVLTDTPVLALFNPGLNTKISADSSSYGLGAVILQCHDNDWRPVAYASRSLTETEQRYAQIDKEALAVVWACEKFEDYILGQRSFVIETDHKPLVPLLGTKDLDCLPIRIQRYRLRLMRYSYDIVHVPGKNLYIADTLSRAPHAKAIYDDLIFQNDTCVYVHSIMNHLPASDKRLEQIRSHQNSDDVCKQLLFLCLKGWPEYMQKLSPELRVYYSHRGNLSIVDNLLMYDSRIVIPKLLQANILSKIHEGHLGITKCRELAKSSVWWPGLSNNIATFITNCEFCCKKQINRLEPLEPTEFPKLPWQKVASDLFEIKNVTYLLVIDFYSRYIEVVKLNGLSSNCVINHLKSLFSHHGIPEILVSDNGCQYSSDEFAQFAKDYSFTHQTMSPTHSSGNGEAERGVRTAKQLMSAEDPYIAFLNYRNAPLRNGFSPSELLMGRKLRSKIPVVPYQLERKEIDSKMLQDCETELRSKQKRNFDNQHGVKSLKPLEMGDYVYIKNRKESGIVKSKVSDRSYFVTTDTGDFRRNRFHLNKLPNNNSIQNTGCANKDPSSSNNCKIIQPVKKGPDIVSNSNTCRPKRNTKRPNRFDD
ncbi:hypothetical protein SNE40_006752 [Patella caerulea]|uniref:Endonuclease n=1 Tax=Patella caerulea TaxID=87958 RepID=A0AAN8JUR7_PATCE